MRRPFSHTEPDGPELPPSFPVGRLQWEVYLIPVTAILAAWVWWGDTMQTWALVLIAGGFALGHAVVWGIHWLHRAKLGRWSITQWRRIPPAVIFKLGSWVEELDKARDGASTRQELRERWRVLARKVKDFERELWHSTEEPK